MVAAGGPTDPLAPPPHGRETAVPTVPSTPKAAAPSVDKPADAKAPRAPSVPVAAKPVAPRGPTKASAAGTVQEPEEEAVVDAKGKMKLRTIGRPSRKTTVVEHDDVSERKNPWSTERYAAVVPPGLTLAALRNQLNKGAVTTPESAGSTGSAGAPERPSSQTLSDIEKAREALRQETARLEALLKASANCGGGGTGMPMGDSVMPTPVSQAALREAAAGEQMDSVSKAMKGMKPEQAAAVIARLDRGLAAEILRRMKASDAGAILGLLKPELAAELATEIAIRKPSIPKDKKGGAK
jgi:flagellar motility protein MotE (MotC chaperone)